MAEGGRVWRQGLKANPGVVVAQTRGREGGRGAGFGRRVWRLIPRLWWLRCGLLDGAQEFTRVSKGLPITSTGLPVGLLIFAAREHKIR